MWSFIALILDMFGFVVIANICSCLIYCKISSDWPILQILLDAGISKMFGLRIREIRDPDP